MANTKYLLLMSSRDDDYAFGRSVSKELERELVFVSTQAEAKKMFSEYPNSAILIDAEDGAQFESLAKGLSRSIPRSRMAVITDKPLQNYPALFENPIYGHHVVRRYNDTTSQLFSRILAASMTPKVTGLERLFPNPSAVLVQKIQLGLSSHKKPAVEAVRNFLIKLGTTERLATQIARACDELLMNAIFDAPVLKDGTRYRRDSDRTKPFEIEGGVTLAFAEAKDYAAISVSDNFGSLEREQILFSLQKDYQQKAYPVRNTGASPALGIHSIVKSGLTLVFFARPKLNTEVILFFPKVSNYREFQKSFSFFGIIGI
jgi:hypothetical protein